MTNDRLERLRSWSEMQAYVYGDGIKRLLDERKALLEALRMVLPLAEAYMSGAPTHSDNAKLEDARAALVRAEDR